VKFLHYLPHRQSFLLRFPFYIGLTATVIFLIIALWSVQQYIAQQDKIVTDLKTQTNQLERSYNVLVDHTSSLMQLIASQIDPNHTDPDSIDKILARFRSSPQLDNMYTWTTFSWVDARDRLSVTSFLGIIKNPIDISTRDYLVQTRKNPGKLFLGLPVMGPIQNHWITPGGIGIVNNNHYIGTVTVGLDTALLANHLQHAITENGIYFVLLDKHYHEVPGMQSDHPLTITPPPPASLPYLSLTSLSHQDSYYITALTGYPYYLYIGYDWHTATRELWQSLGMHLEEIAIIGLVMLILLRMIYSHIIRPLVALSESADIIASGGHIKKLPRGRSYEMTNLAIQLAKLQRLMRKERQMITKLAEARDVVAMSDHLRDRFARRISFELRTPLNKIAETIELLMMHHLGKLPQPLSADEEQQSLKDAYQAMLQLQLFTPDKVTLTDTDPAALIKESISIKAADAMHKQLTIIQAIDTALPTLHTDETKFKQVITGLLTRILDFSPEKTVIRVSATTITENGKRFLSITIDDNGLGFDNQMRSKWQSRWEESGLGLRPDGTDFSPEMITRLLEYLGGTICYEDIPAKGSKVSLRFPYDETEPPASFIEYLSARENDLDADNVIPFSRKD